MGRAARLGATFELKLWAMGRGLWALSSVPFGHGLCCNRALRSLAGFAGIKQNRRRSFAWRLTLASRRYAPKAPVRLRKPARRQRRRLQQNAAGRHRLKRIPNGARRIATGQMSRQAEHASSRFTLPEWERTLLAHFRERARAAVYAGGWGPLSQATPDSSPFRGAKK